MIVIGLYGGSSIIVIIGPSKHNLTLIIGCMLNFLLEFAVNNLNQKKIKKNMIMVAHEFKACILH
jgi:hypothetical protein